MKKYALFLPALLAAACNSGEQITSSRISEPCSRVIEYTPAPGQFINEPKSGYDQVTSPETACAYALQRFAKRYYLSLGGWGGYVVVGFKAPVPNSQGDYDLWVQGNTVGTNTSEPGTLWVMQDTNGDGQANDTWYELAGSRYAHAQTIHDYRITYTRPEGDNQPIAWTDNHEGKGVIDRVDAFHTQKSYYPAWIDTPTLSFEGSRLPGNVSEGTLEGAPGWLLTPFEWGYADNESTVDAAGALNRFRIADAKTATGEAAELTQIDFVKVQSGINEWRPTIGEISTDVCGIGCYRTVNQHVQ